MEKYLETFKCSSEHLGILTDYRFGKKDLNISFKTAGLINH